MAALSWRWLFPRAAAVCLALVCAGWTLAALATWRAPAWPDLPRHATVLTGSVSLVEALPEGRRVMLAAPSLDGDAPLRRTLRIRLRASDPTLVAAGDVVRVRALVRAPSPPDYPGGWDTQRDAFFAGLAGYGFAIGPATVVRGAAGGWWAALRAGVAARLMAGLPGVPGALAATLLTGLGTAIPPGDRVAFQDSGLAHLLAVAGLHIGIVTALVYAATRLGLATVEHTALYWPTRRIAAVAGLAAGGFYLLLTGAHVPILRSFAMAALVTLGVLTGRRAVSLRGLTLAALLLMVLAPASVVGVSFQMSFASVLVLIAGYELARPVLLRLGPGAWWRGPALYGAGLVLTSLLAGTASLPFAAYHFGRATLYYVPANMLAVPITALWVMPWGLVALALMPLGIERMALWPMGIGLRAVDAIAHAVSSWPAATVPVPAMPGWALAMVAFGLAWGGLWRGRLRLLGSVPLAAGLLAPLAVQPPDVLVGPEARLVAVRAGGHVLVERSPGASPFEAEATGRVWGGMPAESLASPGCNAESCRVRLRGGTVLVARDRDGADCAGVRLIVSPVWLHEPCPGVATVDRHEAWRDGAVAAWLTGDRVTLLTDRALRGDRPWVLLPPPMLPMAPTE